MSFATIPKYKMKPYSLAPELLGGGEKHHPFIIVGSGPVGLALALDLARKGHQVTLVTAFDFISAGSKGICYSKQSLDIFDRLGIGRRVLAKGVTWNIGKVFWKDKTDPVYQFDMLAVKGQKNPAFVNIQQYYVEDFLVDALEAMDNVDIRWGHRVTDIETHDDGVSLDITTRDGDYSLSTDYVLACDGARSTIRDRMGLDFQGRIFEDNFLIADIKLKHDHPAERWFWFDPPFCPGGTALLHKQPDDIWRCDFQLGWDIDRESAIRDENVDPFIRGMFGEGTAYEKEWYSIYTFQCRRMDKFVHGPIIFVGDSAHLVSPFGARGANSGFSDAENIAWKLDLILKGQESTSLLESYNYERTMGADENILNSSRSTDFMTPKSVQSLALRDAVLELASDHAFARPYVNSGRLSMPTPYHESPLSTPDEDIWEAGIAPGFTCLDALLPNSWLLEKLGGAFKLMHFGGNPPDVNIECILLSHRGEAASRYDSINGGTYLVRPDQVIAARWKKPDPRKIARALARAKGMKL